MRTLGAALLAIAIACALCLPASAHARHHHHHRHHARHHRVWHHRHLKRRHVAVFDAGGHEPVTIQSEVFGRPAPFNRTFNPVRDLFTAGREIGGAVSDVAAVPRGRVFQWVASYARQLDVPRRVALAVTIQEGASCTKIGGVGERGPMQVRPQTARAMGLHPRSCQEWTRAGVLYLKQALEAQMSRYGLWRAVSAYNHGWGRVYGSHYGSSVMRIMARLT